MSETRDLGEARTFFGSGLYGVLHEAFPLVNEVYELSEEPRVPGINALGLALKDNGGRVRTFVFKKNQNAVWNKLRLYLARGWRVQARMTECGEKRHTFDRQVAGGVDRTIVYGRARFTAIRQDESSQVYDQTPFNIPQPSSGRAAPSRRKRVEEEEEEEDVDRQTTEDEDEDEDEDRQTTDDEESPDY